jgi:hypothetical protein
MKILSTKVHGVMDYLVGLLLISSPWLFGFPNGGAQTTVPVTLGISTLLYSLITNYEYSAAKILPFSTHLLFDVLSGLFLASSPWLFGFNDTVYLPHLVFGLLELGVVLISKKKAGQQRVRSHAYE